MQDTARGFKGGGRLASLGQVDIQREKFKYRLNKIEQRKMCLQRAIKRLAASRPCKTRFCSRQHPVLPLLCWRLLLAPLGACSSQQSFCAPPETSSQTWGQSSVPYALFGPEVEFFISFQPFWKCGAALQLCSLTDVQPWSLSPAFSHKSANLSAI